MEALSDGGVHGFDELRSMVYRDAKRISRLQPWHTLANLREGRLAQGVQTVAPGRHRDSYVLSEKGRAHPFGRVREGEPRQADVFELSLLGHALEVVSEAGAAPRSLDGFGDIALLLLLRPPGGSPRRTQSLAAPACARRLVWVPVNREASAVQLRRQVVEQPHRLESAAHARTPWAEDVLERA
jgi:hypothetical protein